MALEKAIEGCHGPIDERLELQGPQLNALRNLTQHLELALCGFGLGTSYAPKSEGELL